VTVLVLPAALRARIADEARAALPGECCGLIEGRRDGVGRVVAAAVHPARNIGGGDDRFEIDPADHIRILRAARARGMEIVGCYHSHPNGRAEPSSRDLVGAVEVGFVWLIAALERPRNRGDANGSDRIAGNAMGDGAAAGEAVTLAAFAFVGGGFVPVLLAETAALDPARGLWV
jgi:proteasome lid subunit RPN8/RPN11